MQLSENVLYFLLFGYIFWYHWATVKKAEIVFQKSDLLNKLQKQKCEKIAIYTNLNLGKVSLMHYLRAYSMLPKTTLVYFYSIFWEHILLNKKKKAWQHRRHWNVEVWKI